MKRRIFSLLLALCLIVGLLPAVAIPHAHAAVTTATVTLFGVSTTIDLDETTTDIPEARYWVDDGTNIPAAATEDQIAEGTWNYSFAIIDDIPTVTLRNADYKYSKSVVYGKYDGKFRLAYEGINNVFVPYSSSETRYFMSFSASTNGVNSERRVYITGAEGAVLNITGGDNSDAMISTGNKVYVEVSGGTLSVEKTTAGGTSPVVSFHYCPVTIKNCTMSVINNTKVNNQRPVLTGAYGSYYFNVDDANLYVESWANIGICAGVWNVNKTIDGVKVGGVDSPAVFDVTGKSDIKVVNTYTGTHPYAGTGIYAGQVKMTGGNLEAQGTSLGLRLTNATPFNLGSYTADYNMFLEKDGAAVSEYVAGPYFKLATCDHSKVEGVEEITKNPTCTEVGSKNITYTCAYGHTWTETAEIPVLPHTPGEAVPDSATGEFVYKCVDCGAEVKREPCEHPTTEVVIDGTDFVTKCTACGAEVEREAATELETDYAMTIHGYSYTLTHYDIPIYLVNNNTTAYYWATVEEEVEVTNPETGETTIEKQSVTKAVSGAYTAQTKTGATEENYNAKLIWHSGDAAPTLYLRDFVIDAYNEELGGKWRNNGTSKSNVYTTAAIHTGSAAPLTIIVDGTCVMQTYEGIHYQNELTIKGADDEATLTIYTNRTGILPSNMGNGYAANDGNIISGNKLVLDVNLDITQTGWANQDYGKIIRTVGADMIINGGNIVTGYTGPVKTCWGIAVMNSGDLYVNGGYVYSRTYNTSNQTDAAYMVAGDIYVTGGTLEAYAEHQSGVKATNIYISGGKVLVNASLAGLLVDAKTGVIEITGGEVDIYCSSTSLRPFAYYSSGQVRTTPTVIAPEGKVLAITAGSSRDDGAEIKNTAAYNYSAKYVKMEFVDAPACEHTNVTTTEETLVDATCTVAGSKKVTVTCECGEVISEEIVEIAAKGHTEKTDVETKAATCTEAGYTKTTVTCTVCGETISETTETIDALGHTEKTDVETKAATCTEDGYTKTTVTCSVCGETISETTEEIKALGHTEAEAVKENVVAADCDDAGSYDMVVYCSVCKTEISRETFTVDAVGHTEETLPGKDATCTETGLTEGKKCTVCGVITVEQTVIDALGHTEKTDVETKAATCTEAGYTKTTVTCTVCGETVSETTETIDALGHTEKTDVETKAATCTEAGYTKTTVTCTVCGETISETTEEIVAAGHTEVTTTETKEATCGAAGYTKTIVTCSICGETISETVDEIPATGNHVYDDANDTTCNDCGYVRGVEPTFELGEDNKLIFVDPNADHIYHRVTVYFLGEKTVEDITLTNPLKELDPNAKTHWGIAAINKVVLQNPGNYVLHLHYNTEASPKILIAKEVTVAADAFVPTLEIENGKLVVTDESETNINHRATVYYLGAETVNNVYNVEALKAIDSAAKTYWTLAEIEKVQFTKSGNYVVVLDYNTPGSSKLTVAKAFTVVVSRPTISRDGYKLKVTDNDASHKNHRATIYFVGSQSVDIYDEAALKAIDASAKTYWGLTAINKAQMATPGTYVIYLSYNLASGVKQTVVVKTTTRMPVPSVWLEENGQIGTIVPPEVAHRNYVIYYLGDQTVEDIYDIEALKAIDPDPICFDNQKQIAERGVLTEKGNYVLVMYYNYLGSARQVIAEFATLK